MGRGGMARAQIAGIALLSLGLIAGCQSDNPDDALDLAAGNGGANGGQSAPIRESELRAYCPSVMLREGTAYFNTYERGAKDDANRIVYQASIGDVTRNCSYSGATTTVNVAVAGRVVPGPKGKAGTATMPIRIVMLRDGQVAFSQLFQHAVAIPDTIGATQFVYTNSSITVPSDARNVVIFAGYDDGTPAKRN